MVYTAHLLVVCHGLWGQTSHIAYICRSALEHVKSGGTVPLRRRSSPSSDTLSSGAATASASESASDDTLGIGEREATDGDGVRLVVLPTKLNEWTNTYDGIDICAERVLKEIDQECERILQDGGKVERFSIVGYSLGGLVARYVLGLLESRSPSFFDEVKPVNFCAFASPWIGIPQYKSFWSNLFRFLGARLLSRSGAQLYMTDRYLPSSLVDGNQQPAEKRKSALGRMIRNKEKAEPLLAVMADPRYSFYKALSKFERCELYANTVNDRTVPYPTGALEAHDPFSLARAKAQKAAEERDEPDAKIDIRDGGLEITLESGAAIVASFQQIEPPVHTTSEPRAHRRRLRFRLPLLLRPTSYPFSRPVSLLLIVFIPITLPATVLFFVGRFLIATRQSRRRILSARREMGGGREGMLARVGVGLQEVAEAVRADNPEYAAGLSEDLLNGQASSHSELANGGKAEYLDTPSSLASSDRIDTGSSALRDSPATHSSSDGAPDDYLPTDPILTPAQVEMLRNLNALPKLRKHLVWLPESRNSHGAIIARDLRFEQHRPGTKIVDSWARKFVL